MKKATAALAAALVLIAGIFVGCNGADTGKVSDTNEDLGGVITEMATDISDMFDGGAMTSDADSTASTSEMSTQTTA